jgi:hypothetical protein
MTEVWQQSRYLLALVLVLVLVLTAGLSGCSPEYRRSTDAAGCPLIHAKGEEQMMDWEDLVNNQASPRLS